MIRIGKRIVNTLRVFNIKNGLMSDMEAPSPRYGSAPVDGPVKGIAVSDNWDLIKEIYYGTMGWNPHTGKPYAETLKDLDLGDLISDLGD
jgi:aldehyde:ferredoxin oxidoreductase